MIFSRIQISFESCRFKVPKHFFEGSWIYFYWYTTKRLLADELRSQAFLASSLYFSYLLLLEWPEIPYLSYLFYIVCLLSLANQLSILFNYCSYTIYRPSIYYKFFQIRIIQQVFFRKYFCFQHIIRQSQLCSWNIIHRFHFKNDR